MMRKVALAVSVAGVVLVLLAVAQPLKSELGQALLDREFNARLAASPAEQHDRERWKPWPWADLAPVAELHFPDLDERRVVADSASDEALAWAVGHMRETADLGEPGVSVVAGHRDGSFALLGNIHEGDVVDLTTLDGGTVRYVVHERLVVDSRVAQLPIVHSGPDDLVLTTCWPIQALSSGPERLVITARPVA